MKSKLIRIGNHVINLEEIAAVEYEEKEDKKVVRLRFAGFSDRTSIKGDEAEVLWNHLKGLTTDINPKPPEEMPKGFA